MYFFLVLLTMFANFGLFSINGTNTNNFLLSQVVVKLLSQILLANLDVN